MATIDKRKTVSKSNCEVLRKTIEGVRDSALVIVGETDKEWSKIIIDWKEQEAFALLHDLGGLCLSFTLHSKTSSSNGVIGTSDFFINLRPDSHDEPSDAYEFWIAKWSHPVPGHEIGSRYGNPVAEQLSSNITRFLRPIESDNVFVSVV